MFQFIYVKQWSAQIVFFKKKEEKRSVLLCVLEDYWQCFFCKSNIWGEVVAYICLQRGGRSWGEMSTLSLWINPLGRSSKELLHVSTSRMDKGGRSLTVRGAYSLPRTHTLSRGSARFQDLLIKSQWFLSERTVMCCTLLSVHPNRTLWLMRLHAMVDVNTIYTALIQPPPGAGLLEHVSDNQPERQTGAQPPEYGPCLCVVILSEHAR